MAPLADRLATLGLRVTAAHLDDVVALATKRRWSPVQLLEHLAETEQQDRAAVEAALRLDFLAEARNVVLVAAQGLGKTMIAQNLAHAAVLAGYSSSTKSGTSRTTPAPPTCSSRSSAGAMNAAVSSSPPTCPSANGPRSSPTPPRPPRSSIAWSNDLHRQILGLMRLPTSLFKASR